MTTNNVINAPLPIVVDQGGSGNTSATAYAVLCGGTTSTGVYQSIVSVGTLGQVLTSNGPGALPTMQSVGSVALPTGTIFNVQQGQLTTSTSSSSATFVDTGITISITPTSASNTVLVRAVVQFTNDAAAVGMFQLVRGSTPIGIGTSVGSRDAVGSSQYNSNGTASMSTCVMEWLDSPATTSSTTYKVQYAKEGGSGNIYINRSGTDTNSAGFPRTASTITVCEVKV